MIISFEGVQGSGMTLSAMSILYEESRRRGLPVYTNDWSLPYEYFDDEKFREELRLLGEELGE